MFPDDPEPAFAHYHLGRTLALCVTFIISPLLCFSAKAYLFLITVCIGFISLLVLEVRLKYFRKEAAVDTITNEISPKEQPFIKKKTIGSILDSQAGSLSGSCTNVNIQS